MSYIWHEYNLSYLKYAYFNISNKTNFCLGSGRDEIYLYHPTFWFKIIACVWNDVNWKQLFWFEKACLTKKIEVVAFNVINIFLFWVYRKSALPKFAHLYTAYNINIAPIYLSWKPESLKYPSSTIIILYLTYDPPCINFQSQAFF